MNTYFISDFHIAHFNIMSYCNRPFHTTDEMDKHIIKVFNSVVKPEDTVIFGGDFALKARREYLQYIFQQLNGTLHLVKGNHDSSKKKMLDIGFKTCQDRWENEEVIMRHRPYDFTEDELKSDKYCLFGHVHTEYRKWLKPNSFCICVEPLNYIPRTLEQLKELYAPKQEETARVVQLHS